MTGKSFSDFVRRKQRLVTAKQVSLPRLRSDSVVRRPWKGAEDGPVVYPANAFDSRLRGD